MAKGFYSSPSAVASFAGITGVKSLDAKLQTLSNKLLRKVCVPAVNRALTVMAKGVRAKIPAKYKQMKRLVGKRFNKAKGGEYKGLLVAKVGFGVAMPKFRKTKGVWKMNKKHQSSSRKGKGGVGISANNIHWPVLGTKKRRTKGTEGSAREVHSTGRMPPVMKGVVESGVASVESAALAMMRETIKVKLKELATK